MLPLMNLTKINRGMNIAYISTHAAPNLYSLFVYVACIHIHPTALSVFLAIL